jgi:hypothetical protein
VLYNLLQDTDGRKVEDHDRTILCANAYFCSTVCQGPAALLWKPADTYQLLLANAMIYPG